MEITSLGWAGAQLRSDGATLVIDPLADPGAVFAPLGLESPLPEVAAAEAGAVGGLVTHLHRDHADAAALEAALAPGAPVLEPLPGGGDAFENLALAQAEHELSAAGLRRRQVGPWESETLGPFAVTALPAVDGTGDPQVSWLVEAGDRRVLHLGDTTFHGFWWRIARRHGPFDAVLVPVNGAVVAFPHRQPASPYPAVLDPEQAAAAVEILGARVAIPIHAQGYEIGGVYAPVAGAEERFARLVRAERLGPGESVAI